MSKKGKIRVEIGRSGETKIDMSNFKNCSDKTKELLQVMDMEANSIDLKDEEVQTVTTSTSGVNVRR